MHRHRRGTTTVTFYTWDMVIMPLGPSEPSLPCGLPIAHVIFAITRTLRAAGIFSPYVLIVIFYTYLGIISQHSINYTM